jgi:tRNA-splicing ligase RtcB
MPDAHKGYTLPIGSVVKTKDAIVPAYVGYDIGCGMCAIKTTFKKAEVTEYRDDIFQRIRETVPVGRACHDAPVTLTELERSQMDPSRLTKVGQEVYVARNGAVQLGTLGGGNHFIEIGYDKLDKVWVIIHSGSRGFGHGLASHYMKVASSSDKAREGHFPLAVGSDQGKAYMNDLSYALDYALLNRKLMIARVLGAMNYYVDGEGRWDMLINRNHNHAELLPNMEVIHRKGATHAEDGMMGVIPGNMRDGSFIVRGKGNPESMSSSSHGAGRVLSRSKAKEEVSMEEFKESMDGITACVHEGTLDESPMAYKNIFEVMEQQADLVDVVARVKPLINVKG